MAPRNIGPFEIDRQIGIGGMGIVYSAVYKENGRKVAVKVLSPQLSMDRKVMKRFEREIEILKRLDHPNIVKYFGGGTENGQRYYAMEFIDGGSLQDKLTERKRFSWEQAIHVGRQVSSALEHAHNAGIIHRDLKPANLFLSKKGRLKLGDFGIARDTEATALTAAGKTVGSYPYMAPEQIQATHPITRKTDLYALGCLLYEVLVGETPFLSATDNPMDMLLQHLNDDPYNVVEKVPDCPPMLDSLIERLLAKDPDDRPHDALAVHTELGEIRDAIKAGHSVSLGPTVVDTKVPAATKESTKPAGAKKKKKKKKKRENVPFYERTWFLVTALVLLLGVGYWLSRPQSEEWHSDGWKAEMPTGTEDAQKRARDEYILPYLEIYPDGKYADEANEYLDEVRANSLEAPTKNRAKRHLEDPSKAKDQPDSPLEADCYDAILKEFEEGVFYFPTWTDSSDEKLTANPLPTMQRWKRILDKHSSSVDPADEKSRGLLRLSRNHFDYFFEKFVRSDDAERYFGGRLQEAERTNEKKEVKEAKEIWDFLYKTFGKVSSFKELAEYARQRYNGFDVPRPDVMLEPEAPEPAADGAKSSDGDN